MSQEIKDAKRLHKQALRNKFGYKAQRDNLVKHLLGNPTPKWGGFKISLVNWCFVLVLLASSCTVSKPVYKGGNFAAYQQDVQKYYQRIQK